MSRLIQNAVILTAGAFIMAGAAIAVAIILLYALGVTLGRRIKGTPRPALTPGL